MKLTYIIGTAAMLGAGALGVVYDGLNKLKDRGLVSESTLKNKTFYVAAPPQ